MKYEDCFKKQHVMLPVIHCVTVEQTLQNVGLAVNEGADGIFLITHHQTDDGLMGTTEEVHSKYSHVWLGVNRLGLGSLASTFRDLPAYVKGVWNDNAGCNPNNRGHFNDGPHGIETCTKTWRNMTRWEGLYFGGVAFKYQGFVPLAELKAAGAFAARVMEVITTSGPGTGEAAEVERIERLREGAGPDAKIAIASGITPENVESYLPYANAFLVATGISSDFKNLDPKKVRQLRAAIPQ
jgi:hypothetical protein